MLTYLFLLAGSAVAQTASQPRSWNFDGLPEKIYQHILALQFEKARDLVSKIPEPPYAVLYLTNLNEALETAFVESYSSFQRFEDHFEDRIDQLKNANEDPHKRLFLAELKLQWAFVNMKFGNEFTAAWNIRQAYRLVEKNQELYPDFLPNAKPLGILHIMFGSIPDRYNWLLDLLGLGGTVAQGMDELSTLAESDHLFATEALIIQCLVQSYMLQQTNEAVMKFSNLYGTKPQTPLYAYLFASLLIKNSQSDKALEVLNRVPSTDIPLFSYLKADVYLQKGQYDKSIQLHQKFISSHQGENFIKDSYYKIGLAYWLDSKTGPAQKFFNQAKRSGLRRTETDKHAARSLEDDILPNQAIMQIRLFTDGGYFHQADSLIANFDEEKLITSKDRVEFKYRKARLYHKTGRIEKAIDLYLGTIRETGNERWYFAPNSALQLGYIYQDRGNTGMAQNHFRKALSYKNHEYKNSIDNKAKSALSDLKK